MNLSRRLSLGLALLMSLTSSLLAGEPRQLTSSTKLKFSPVFFREGRELLFVELADPTIYRIQRLELATGKITPLNPDAKTSEFEPTVAADGECYAYLKTKGPLSIGITICDSEGSLLSEITPEPGFFGFRAPTLAPGKSRIAFSFGDGGTQQIYSSRINGGDRKQLTKSNGLNHWPAYSPDGKWIAFGSSRDGNYEIYVMTADGNDSVRITEHPLQDIRPAFSPDGQQIAFTSQRDGNAEIYIVQADGSNLRRITNHPERDDYPQWHPDGKHLVSISERKGRHEVFLWDLEQ